MPGVMYLTIASLVKSTMFSCFKPSNKVHVIVLPRVLPPYVGSDVWVDTKMLTDRLENIVQRDHETVDKHELLRSAEELKKDFQRLIPYCINMQIDILDSVIANLQDTKCDAMRGPSSLSLR